MNYLCYVGTRGFFEMFFEVIDSHLCHIPETVELLSTLILNTSDCVYIFPHFRIIMKNGCFHHFVLSKLLYSFVSILLLLNPRAPF